MKKFALAAAIAATGTAAMAGGFAEPIIEAPIEIVEDTAASSSSAGLVVPLLLLAIIAAAAAN